MKFNTILQKKQTQPSTHNLAGGEAFEMSDKAELATILLTSFLDNKFYRSGNDTAKRLIDLVHRIDDKRFVAKAALYARREAGMRSVAHLVAGEIAHSVKGQTWTKDFFDRIVYRVDDALEILAYTIVVHGKPIPNSMKKGLGKALTRFDEHQLAKYRKDSAALKLVDAVNLVHPPHTEALAKLINGELAAANTWETKLTQAGQNAGSDEDKAEKKTQVWKELVRSGKIGYFALLRNLRNIVDQAPELTDDAVSLLTDKNRIRKSLVMPFRFRTALDALEEADLPRDKQQAVLRALSKAVDTSLANVPKFAGRTLIALDCSGSMSGKPMKIGSLFAAVLYKSNDADVMLFSDKARYQNMNTDDATLSLAQRLEGKANWGGTNFHGIFETARESYERIVILSDMQAWIGYHTPRESFAEYVNRHGLRPKIYSFDLAGYGTLQFPEKDVYTMAGFSDKTMDMMRFLEEDKTALIREIENINL